MLRLLEKRASRGQPVPALDSKLELYQDLQPVWKAFSQLHTSRPSGMGACGLRVTDIQSWLTMNGYTGVEELQEMYELILTLDASWLKWQNEKLDQEKEKKKKAKSQEVKGKKNGHNTR